MALMQKKPFEPCSNKWNNRKHWLSVYHWHLMQLTTKNKVINCIVLVDIPFSTFLRDTAKWGEGENNNLVCTATPHSSIVSTVVWLCSLACSLWNNVTEIIYQQARPFCSFMNDLSRLLTPWHSGEPRLLNTLPAAVCHRLLSPFFNDTFFHPAELPTSCNSQQCI